jgi:hypothetical protein
MSWVLRLFGEFRVKPIGICPGWNVSVVKLGMRPIFNGLEPHIGANFIGFRGNLGAICGGCKLCPVSEEGM